MHQNLIDRQPVQPGGKGRLTSKASNFSKELYEDLLGEVLSLRDISSHPQAQGINPAVVPLVKVLEGIHITFCGLLRQRVIGWLCPGFGCGHVSICSRQRQRERGYHDPLICSPRFSRVRRISNGANIRSPLKTSAQWGSFCEVSGYPLNAGVMRRFARVVAFPESKNDPIYSPLNNFALEACRNHG